MKTAIVLITYNHQKFIYDALEGIRKQTVQPDEVIIADDCSNDNTQKIICEYVREFNLETNWQLLFNSKNKGINLNLQDAIDITTAEIIIPMSGDDISLPNRCQVALDLFVKYPHIHIVSTSVYKIDENKNKIGKISYNDELINDVKKVIIAGTPNVFPVGQNWKRSVFDKFGKLPLNVPNEDDQITFRGILDQGIFCSSVKTVLYRVHQNSASAWHRNNQSNQEYFSMFIQDMTVRGLHMEHWGKALSKVVRDDEIELMELLKYKVELYKFLKNIEGSSFFLRIFFFIRIRRSIGLREMYYILFGKFGVLSWRSVKRFLGK